MRKLKQDGTPKDAMHIALIAARHQLVAAFGIVRSHATKEHIQNYQRAIMLCDAALAPKA